MEYLFLIALALMQIALFTMMVLNKGIHVSVNVGFKGPQGPMGDRGDTGPMGDPGGQWKTGPDDEHEMSTIDPQYDEKGDILNRDLSEVFTSMTEAMQDIMLDREVKKDGK